MEPRIAQVKAYLTLVVLFLVLAASKSAAEAIGASFLPLWLSLSLCLLPKIFRTSCLVMFVFHIFRGHSTIDGVFETLK
jgi:uncharacterized membrane protein YhdT